VQSNQSIHAQSATIKTHISRDQAVTLASIHMKPGSCVANPLIPSISVHTLLSLSLSPGQPLQRSGVVDLGDGGGLLVAQYEFWLHGIMPADAEDYY
jgi:hypothetical protein